MKVKIYSADAAEKGSVILPQQFDSPVRPDLIRRAVFCIWSRKRQAYGAYEWAGMRSSSEVSKRRRDYRGSYGIGISRVPRKVLSRRGTRMNWVGALAPHTVKGRRAHPPKSEKIWNQKLNKKENSKAICSAIAATMHLDYVKARGHKVAPLYPFIIDDSIEQMAKAKDLNSTLLKFGFADEINRTRIVRLRKGRGKSRGRKTKTPVGPLFVVGKDCPLMRASKNLPGISAITVDSLNADILAPGTHPGRLTIFSAGAIERLGSEGLYLPKRKTAQKVAPEQKEKPARSLPGETKKAIQKPAIRKPKAPKKKARDNKENK